METFLYILVGGIIIYIIAKAVAPKKTSPYIAPPRKPEPFMQRPVEDKPSKVNKLNQPFDQATENQEPYHLVIYVKAGDRPQSYDASPSDTKNWPQPVEIAWLSFNVSGELIDEQSHYFQRKTRLSDNAKDELNITDEFLKKEGKPSLEILEAFAKVSEQSKVLVSHNLEYQSNLIQAENFRADGPAFDLPKRYYCVMKKGTNYCQIPKDSGYGYKWPSLNELIAFCFLPVIERDYYEREREDSALEDARLVAKCYFEMIT